MELHGREMTDEFCLKMLDFHVQFRDLLHAVILRHGRDGFTFPPKEGVLRIFFCPEKNPTVSVGFEPANLGTEGQHATSRPSKRLTTALNHFHLQSPGLCNKCNAFFYAWLPLLYSVINVQSWYPFMYFPCWQWTVYSRRESAILVNINYKYRYIRPGECPEKPWTNNAWNYSL